MEVEYTNDLKSIIGTDDTTGQEPDLPVSYQRRQCNEIMKLGMQGVTVVVSSGDSGVGEARGTNIANCLGPNGTVFNPDFPVTCPYITSSELSILSTSTDILVANYH